MECLAVRLLISFLIALVLCNPSHAQRRLRPVMSMVPTGDFGFADIFIDNDTPYYIVGTSASSSVVAPFSQGSVTNFYDFTQDPTPGFYRADLQGYEADEFGEIVFNSPIFFTDPALEFRTDLREWMYASLPLDSRVTIIPDVPVSLFGRPSDPSRSVSGGEFIDHGQFTSLNVSVGTITGSTIVSDITTTGTTNFTGNATTEFVLAWNSATVNMTGGTVTEELKLYEFATANLLGGIISGTVTAHAIWFGNLFGQYEGGCTVNVGGTVQINKLDVEGDNSFNEFGEITDSYGESTVNMSGGFINKLTATGDAIVNVSGGTITTFITDSPINFETVPLGNDGLLTITGGTIDTLLLNGTFVANISGGHISDLVGKGNSLINLYGGLIDQNTISLKDTSVLNIYGTNLTLSILGGGVDDGTPYTEYLLTGILREGQRLNGIHLRDYFGGFQIEDPSNPNGPASPLNFIFVDTSSAAPEPGTIVLLLIPFSIALAWRRTVLPRR